MGVYYETIPESLIPWINQQQMLWVGTAPLSPTGHINISPKSCVINGRPSFGILSPSKFWYQDLTGSGVETHAHIYEPGNGRICIMFLAFTGPPKIVRLWGTGSILENGSAEFSSFIETHNVDVIPGSRSIILIDIQQCGTSCGFSVPNYEFKGHREVLNDFFRKKEERDKEGREGESMDHYWAYKSQLSIDNLPGMKRGVAFAQAHDIAPLKKWVGKNAPSSPSSSASSSTTLEPIHLLLVLLLGIIIGGAMSLSVVTPERVRALQEKGGVVM